MLLLMMLSKCSRVDVVVSDLTGGLIFSFG